MLVQEILFCLGSASRPSTTYFFPHRTLFQFLCPPSASRLGRQSYWVAFLFVCVSGWVPVRRHQNKRLGLFQYCSLVVRSTVIKWRNEYLTARPSPLLLNILRSFTTARSLQTSSTTSLQGCSHIRLHCCATIISYTATKIPFMYSFPVELRGLSPNFHIHVSVSDLCVPRIGPHIFLQQNRQTDPGNI